MSAIGFALQNEETVPDPDNEVCELVHSIERLDLAPGTDGVPALVANELKGQLSRRSFGRFIAGKAVAGTALAAAFATMREKNAGAWWFDPNSYTTPICCRCYRVTQWSQVGSHVSGENRFAIDIGTPSWTPVYATKSGTVVRGGWEGGGGGNVVRVNHNDQLQSIFAHMVQVNVRVGQWVNKDYTLLGYTGASGNVTGPHLHWALKDQYSATGVNMAGIRGVSYGQICP